MKKLYTPAAFVLLAVAFILFNLLNNTFFKNARVDFTEGSIYTLSEGTKNLLSNLDEPINLYFFFSNTATREIPQIRSYASRVQSLLEEYELRSNGKIKLQIIDPEPFSEAEDQADAYGLQGVRMSNFGDTVYFGLAGTNTLDDQGVLPFFQAQKEIHLEYDISQLIYKLANPEPAKIAIYTGLPISGERDFRSQQTEAPWQTYIQLTNNYDTTILSPDFSDFDPESDLLLMIQPPKIRPDIAFAIDQYVMQGGHVLVFVDPVVQGGSMGGDFRNLEMLELMAHWGIQFDSGSLIADANQALRVGSAQGGSVRHLAVLSVLSDQIDQEDVATSNLETINVAMAGYVKPTEEASTTFTSIITTTELSGLLPAAMMQFIQGPQELAAQFQPDPDKYTIGARVSGPLKTMFPDREEAIQETDNVNIVVFSDVDMLQDWLWIRTQQIAGQTIAQPWSDNGSLFINTVDNLIGSSDLISLRSRGQFERPFEVVNKLRASAEDQYRASEQSLMQQLQEAEQRLQALESQKTEGSELVLTDEQRQAILDFQEQRIEIRKELRDVRHQLDKDIESLGTRIKLLNIAVFPVILTLLVFAAIWLRRKTRVSV